MTEEIHDTSRVNSFMASRRRAMLFHSVWKPMLAGAVGAAIIVGAVWAASPRLHYNEIEVPRVTLKDVIVPNVIQKDVTVDHVVPHDVQVDHIVPHDVPMANPVPLATPAPGPVSDSSPAPRDQAEKKFEDSKGWQEAIIHGRILRPDKNGFVMMTDENGEQSFYPAIIKPDGTVSDNPGYRDVVDEYVGDLGYCRPRPQERKSFDCTALHNGREVHIQQLPVVADPSAASLDSIPLAKSAGGRTAPATAAMDMITVDVDLGYQKVVNAMVDTGCSWPLSLPSSLADVLLKTGFATRAGKSSSVHADGSEHDVDIIMLKSIAVDGRVLMDVEASVAPSQIAPVLLGLGALNRLGAFKIEEGRLVFAGGQPA